MQRVFAVLREAPSRGGRSFLNWISAAHSDKNLEITMGVTSAPFKSPMGSPAVPYESVQTMWEARPRKYKNVLFQV
ncbi:hypothetical protein PHYPSEUDO_000410, partial [Phytophthora pseudosyringae]